MPMIALQWIFLKKEDVENYLISDQLQLFSEFDRKNSVDNIIRDVCAYIQSRTPESLTISPMAPNHIPNACRTAACHLVIEALQSRIPDIQLTEDQIRNAQQAHTTLNDLFQHWSEQAKRRDFQPRLEAVYYRLRQANHKTMKGL